MNGVGKIENIVKTSILVILVLMVLNLLFSGLNMGSGIGYGYRMGSGYGAMMGTGSSLTWLMTLMVKILWLVLVVGLLAGAALWLVKYLGNSNAKVSLSSLWTESKVNTYNCPNCQTELKEDFRFCPGCKASLKKTCQCGQKLLEDWSFCPHCGMRY